VVATSSQARDPLLRVAGLETLLATWAGDETRAESAFVAAMESGDPPGSAVTEFSTTIAEACLFGFRTDALRTVSRLAVATGNGTLEIVAGTLTAGVLAIRAGDAGTARSSAEALATVRIGPGRARVRVLASYLGAEAADASGHPEESVRAAREGLVAAKRIGHPWFELLLAALIARLRPMECHHLHACVAAQSARLGGDDARARFRRRWLAT
jgi:hypothetical protein